MRSERNTTSAGAPEAGEVLAEAKRVAADGQREQARVLLEKGMADFPAHLDQYGDPAFRKELIRTLLSQRRWKDAEALIPAPGGPGHDGWHHILFARALDAHGRKDEARMHWEAFAATRPDHAEAQAALRGIVATRFPQPFRQILSKVPDQKFDTIFDVGANKGQSFLLYARSFPAASIHAFEPVPQTCAELAGSIPAGAKIRLHRIALSDRDGTVGMAVSGTSTMNHIASASDGSAVEIQARTVASFCAEHDIGHIDFMKIDTEGHDLCVLRGCGEFIRNIDFIQCEASANRYNRYHNAFGDIFDFMTDAGFHLFHLDGLTYEWANGGYPVLRRFDPVFINGRVVGDLKNVVDR